MGIFYVNGFEAINDYQIATLRSQTGGEFRNSTEYGYYDATAGSITRYSHNPGNYGPFAHGTINFNTGNPSSNRDQFTSTTAVLSESRHSYGPHFCYISNASTSGYHVKFPSGLTDIRFGFAIRFDTKLSSSIYLPGGASFGNFAFGVNGPSNTKRFGFMIQSNMTVRMLTQSIDGGASAQIGTDSVATVPTSGWTWIEGRIVFGASGSVELKIGNQTTETWAGIDTRLGSNAASPVSNPDAWFFKGLFASNNPFVIGTSTATALIDDVVFADSSDGTPQFGNSMIAAISPHTSIPGDASSFAGVRQNISHNGPVSSNTQDPAHGIVISTPSTTTASALFKVSDSPKRFSEARAAETTKGVSYTPVTGTSVTRGEVDGRIGIQVLSISTDKNGKYWRVIGSFDTYASTTQSTDDNFRRGNLTQYSTDGIRWYQKSLMDPMPTATNGSTQINGISYGNNMWVAYGSYGLAFTSTDGLTWEQSPYSFGITGDPNGTASIYDVQYSTGISRWIAISGSQPFSGTNGSASWISSSSNILSSSWTAYHTSGNTSGYGTLSIGVQRSFFSNGTTYYGLRALSNSLESVHTSNLATITAGGTPTNYSALASRPFFQEIRFGAGRFVMIGGTGTTNRIWTANSSSSLATITQATTANPFSASGQYPIRLSFDNNIFVTVSNQGKFAYSSDGLTWTLASGGDGCADDLVSGPSSNWSVAELNTSLTAQNMTNCLTSSLPNPYYDGSKWLFSSRLGTAYSSNGTASSWTYVPTGFPSGTSVKAIAVTTTHRHLASAQFNVSLKSGGTEHHGPAETYLNANLIAHKAIYNKNPITNAAWTESEIQALQVGLRKTI